MRYNGEKALCVLESKSQRHGDGTHTWIASHGHGRTYANLMTLLVCRFAAAMRFLDQTITLVDVYKYGYPCII